jgi:hypothetical protein
MYQFSIKNIAKVTSWRIGRDITFKMDIKRKDSNLAISCFA